MANVVGVDVTVGLLRTATREHAGDPSRDRLADLRSARVWSPVPLDADDLEPLRAFREEVRDALRADRDGPAGPVSRFVSTVELAWDPSGELSYAATGIGWRAVAGLVTVELLLAQAAGRLRRLKTCAYEPCGWPFIDESRNVSRVWHDTSKCGNLVNLRAHRARRTATTPGN